MIEVGIFDTGASDLPHRVTPSGLRVLDASLAELQEAAQRLTVNTVHRGVEAERLGYDYYWLVEHHFNIEGTELSPNPLLVQSAIAALTKRIRLGQMANIVLWHHPLRLAEMVAQLDIISGGRLEVGLGRGYQPRESETFGFTYGSTIQDQERNRSAFYECVEVLMKAWTELSFNHLGENFSIPPTYTKWNHAQDIEYFSQDYSERTPDEVFRIGPPDLYSSGPELMASTTTMRELSVLPQPIQKPHPPLWSPCTSERSVRWAAANGHNGNFFWETHDKIKARIDVYMDEAEKQVWPDMLDRGQFKPGWDCEKHRGIMTGQMIHVDEPGIGNSKKALEGILHFWDFLAPFGHKALLADPGQNPADIKLSYELLSDKNIVLYGSKQQVLEGLLAMRDVAYPDGDYIFNAWFEAPGLSQGEIDDQTQYFAEEILPELRRECGGSPERPEQGLSFDRPVERPEPATV